MSIAEAREDVSDMGKLSAYEELLLEASPELKTLSDEDKTKHIENLREYISSLDGYEAKVFEKINEFAEAKKLVDNAKEQELSDETVKELKRDQARLYFELEELGVTTQERIQSSPQYWIEKIQSIKDEIEGTRTNYVSGFDKDSNLHYVHQTDLALKRDALTTVPCIPLDLGPLACVAVASGWNAGSSVADWEFVPLPGNAVFYSATCLDQSTHHFSVDFDMDTLREIDYFFGVATSQNSYTPNFTTTGNCSSNEEVQWVISTNGATTTTTISNISLN